MRSRLFRGGTAAALASALLLALPAQGDDAVWAPTTPIDPQGQRVSLSALPDGTAFASVGAGDYGSILRSGDAGLTWTRMLAQPPTDAGWSTLLSMATPQVGFAANGNIVSSTADGASSWRPLPGVKITKSGLETYEAVAAAAPATGVAGKFGFEFDGECPVPQQTTTLAATADAGRSWRRGVVPFPGFVQHVDMRDNLRGVALVYVVKWSPPKRSDNGACQVDGFSDTTAVLITLDGGRTWQRRMTCAVPCIAADWTRHRLAVATFDGSVFTSVDYGRRWTRTGQVMQRGQYKRVESITFTSPAVGYALVRSTGVYATQDGGRTWALEKSASSIGATGLGAVADAGKRMIAADSAVLLARLTTAGPSRTSSAKPDRERDLRPLPGIKITLTRGRHVVTDLATQGRSARR